MGNYKNKTYPLRVDNVLMEKIDIIAKSEFRPKSKQIELFLRQALEIYENANGEIILPNNNNSNSNTNSKSTKTDINIGGNNGIQINKIGE